MTSLGTLRQLRDTRSFLETNVVGHNASRTDVSIGFGGFKQSGMGLGHGAGSRAPPATTADVTPLPLASQFSERCPCCPARSSCRRRPRGWPHEAVDEAMHFLGNCLVAFGDHDTALVETHFCAYLRLGPAARTPCSVATSFKPQTGGEMSSGIGPSRTPVAGGAHW